MKKIILILGLASTYMLSNIAFAQGGGTWNTCTMPKLDTAQQCCIEPKDGVKKCCTIAANSSECIPIQIPKK